MPPDLSGRTVVLTRAEHQLGAARKLFEAAGAQVLDLPALVIGPPDSWGPLDDALSELEDFHWLVVSSANGVTAVDERLQAQGRSLARRPASLKIAAVGRKTLSSWRISAPRPISSHRISWPTACWKLPGWRVGPANPAAAGAKRRTHAAG